jgi:hypothetical protein
MGRGLIQLELSGMDYIQAALCGHLTKIDEINTAPPRPERRR